MFAQRFATAAPAILMLAAAAGVAGCGSREDAAGPAAASSAPAASFPNGLLLALAQFVNGGEKPRPGPARLEFLFYRDGRWQSAALEDPDSNVFHKAMVYDRGRGPELLTLSGSAAHVKIWARGERGLEGSSLWTRDFGGKFSRMRDAEVADLYGDGKASIAVATHDQGVVAVLRPQGEGFEVVELDRQPDTFVHEIEVGDLDADGILEVYATPSEPNRLDGSVQPGQVVRYVPARGGAREVVVDLGDRHAKEILVDDVDGDGVDELYVSVEGQLGGEEGARQLEEPVEIRRFDAKALGGQGVGIGTLQDRLSRFLTSGDVDGDGKKELVAAAFSSGVWLLRPGANPGGAWTLELVDGDSAGFEHAALLTDLDGDGVDELYVASDRHKQVRRYVWKDGKLQPREVIYVRPDDRPIFTWNLMPFPVELLPGS